jgi:5S rRNA maturation endonuclease (ribonuclease M5)
VNKIFAINHLLAEQARDILSIFGVKLRRNGKVYQGRCPIHAGNRPTSFVMYPDGYAVKCYWRCYSLHCHDIFRPTAFGLVRGLLSNEKGFSRECANKIASFEETLQWSLNFLGKTLEDISIDYTEVRNNIITSQMDIFSRDVTHRKLTSRERVRQSLSIPAKPLLERGFSAEILRSYDIGICNQVGKPMYGRSVVPVYEESGLFLVGCLGRSPFGECGSCGGFHDPAIACPEVPTPKWRVSDGFDTGRSLYNYWAAKDAIRKTGKVYLVEGTLDCLSLVQAGYANSLALFGCNLTDYQQIILEKSSAHTIFLALDNDESGRRGTEDAIRKLRNLFNVKVINLPDGKNDWGEMNEVQIRETLK